MSLKINKKYYLTTDHPVSKYDTPILVDEEGNTYGPSDLIPYPIKFRSVFGIQTFDSVVYSWGTEPERTQEEIEAASLFLSQWPEGMQISIQENVEICNAFPFVIKGIRAKEAAIALDQEKKNLDRLYNGIAPDRTGYTKARAKIIEKIKNKFNVTII